MPLRMPDIGFRHVEAVDTQSRPGLFHEVEKPPGAAADIEKLELALIASGKGFEQRRQRLPPYRIGRAVEQHLDLRVVALCRILRHPAARLEMEILQIIVRPLAARFVVEDFVMRAALAALMDVGKIREEQPRAAHELEQRAVMIGGKRIDPGFDIGEVLHEQCGHVGIEAVAIRHRRVGLGAAPRRYGIAAPRGFGQPPHRDAVADIPGNTRQLADAVCRAGNKSGERRTHVSDVSASRFIIAAIL